RGHCTRRAGPGPRPRRQTSSRRGPDPAAGARVRRGAAEHRSSGHRGGPPCQRGLPRGGSPAWRGPPRSSTAIAPLPRSRRPRTYRDPSRPLAPSSGPRRSALVVAARDALLAPFLVDQRGLAALLAEVADGPEGGRTPAARLRRVALLADVLAEHP